MNQPAAATLIVLLGTWFIIDTTLHLAALVRQRRFLRGDHRERHVMLHRYLDELLADYLTHNRTALPSHTPISDLMTWSHQQTIEPTEARR